MRSDRELLEDALHQLGWLQQLQDFLVIKDLIEEIRASLTEKDHEPFAWVAMNDVLVGKLYWNRQDAIDDNFGFVQPLYLNPRQPVRLSDDEIQECFDIAQKNFSKHQTGIKGQQLTIRDWPNWHFAKAIEQAIMEKNK